jgi:hypothetical protein
VAWDDGGGSYSGPTTKTNWYQYSVQQMWTFVNRQLTNHYEQSQGWKMASELTGLYHYRLQAYRDHLSAEWRNSPAQQAYMAEMNKLIDSVKNIHDTASKNYTASVDIPNALSEAKYKLKPIYDEFIAASNQQNNPQPTPSPSPSGSQPKTPADVMNSKKYEAASVMYALSRELVMAQTTLMPPRPYVAPGKAGSREDYQSYGGGGGSSTLPPSIIPPILPPPPPPTTQIGTLGPTLQTVTPVLTIPTTPTVITPTLPTPTVPTVPVGPLPPGGVLNPANPGMRPPIGGVSPTLPGVGTAVPPRGGALPPGGMIGGNPGAPGAPGAAGVRGGGAAPGGARPLPPGGMIGGGAAAAGGGRPGSPGIPGAPGSRPGTIPPGMPGAAGAPGARGGATGAGAAGAPGRGTGGLGGNGTAGRGGAGHLPGAPGAPGAAGGRGGAAGPGGRGGQGPIGGGAGRAMGGVPGRPGQQHTDEDGEQLDPNTQWQVAHGVAPVVDAPEAARPINPGPAIGLDK